MNAPTPANEKALAMYYAWLQSFTVISPSSHAAFARSAPT